MSKIVGMMLVKNEGWILGASLRAALRWCDEVVVLDHASDDDTLTQIWEVQDAFGSSRVIYREWGESSLAWSEMDARQRLLEIARHSNPSHLALIDADEILTANLLPRVRDWCELVKPGEALEVPMFAVGPGLDEYRDDDTVWSRSWISLLVGYADNLTWKPAGDGYHHHHRLPYGVNPRTWRRGDTKAEGGVMHLQWVGGRRVVAKHVWYRMMETIRYPGRMTAAQLNEKYDAALTHFDARCSDVPDSWWEGVDTFRIDLDDEPWQESACREMMRQHGPDVFSGLDLKGLIPNAPTTARPA